MNLSKSRKKRILYVEQWPGIGGSMTNVLYPMVTGLDRDRYEPLVLFYWPNPYRERFEALGVKTIVFEQSRLWQHPALIAQTQKVGLVKSLQGNKGKSSALYHALGSYVRLSYYIPQIVKLAKLMRANDIDLVHLNSDPTRHGREIVLAAKLTGLPCICYAQNFSEFQAVDRHIARFIDRYVFCSNAIGEHCIKLGKAVPARGCTIYPGVPEVAKWSQPYDTAKIRRELGWSDQDFIAGNIGRLVSWKGQDVFLKALAEVKREVPDIKGLLVGDPTEQSEGQNEQPVSFYEQLLALTESLSLTDNVHFTGFRSDIPQILASVDVFVHSSSEPEPFGTAVIEAMMAARPVIATNAGGMPEMIQDGATGLLVPLSDPQAMARAILFYYRDQARAKRIARAGQQKATTELTAQRHIDEFQALYQTLLA
jgi:glycosyltransferase involved in cell wall biosynthesis